MGLGDGSLGMLFTEMDMNDAIKRRISSVRWSEFPQPSWNKSGSIECALNDLVDGLSSAYDDLMGSICNNHAGTYYPVLLGVIPFLADVIVCGGENSQRLALCFVDDLFASFHPEAGYEKISLDDKGMQDVEVVFCRWIGDLRPELERISRGGERNSVLADSILEVMNSRN